MPTRRYLGWLGLDDVALPPTLGTLRLVHARHLARVPYENLGIMLGNPPSVDPAASLERIATVGRAGYCFHHNGALELVLRDLGFEVERRHGHVWTAGVDGALPALNHLVLVVRDLPTPENPDGRWWADVGIGDGFAEPLPLVDGTYDDAGFRYELADVTGAGWSFRHDPAGSFGGIEVTDGPTTPADVLAAHAELSTPPEGRFTRMLLVQRRDATGVDLLRGCVRSRVEPGGRTESELTSYDAWRAGLAEIGVPLHDVPDDELVALFDRTLAAHQAWTSAGRP
ncbi:arylamine N-acetyltransferase family protein [Nocardioides lianchengensis]|uniref:Arylamine N-acetyltransferase n=1 Tax=Nocardioides lianchengensis TaxID=1045774 RepID=A0A1G6MTN3_9ACTN|nr:arylamine N-acetyltransferase [Nocardioides lianchengensis]NYG10540.1 arylamine N-acetyltransferase [Nocardioides lianchengensis]SDC58903.1 Arylamine N-acetyltransferase [Nocardioides lianchengensis]